MNTYVLINVNRSNDCEILCFLIVNFWNQSTRDEIFTLYFCVSLSNAKDLHFNLKLNLLHS